MDRTRNHQWRWHPIFKDYYIFRRRRVAGTSEYDLIWARSMMEQSPNSPNFSTPPNETDQNEANIQTPFVPNNEIPNNHINDSRMPAQIGQTIQYQETLAAQLENQANNNPSLAYEDGSRASLASRDGSMASTAGPRAITPSSANISSFPYEHDISRLVEEVVHSTRQFDLGETPNIDTFVASSEDFETIRNPRGYFKKGRVFKVSWPEPKGDIPRPTIHNRPDAIPHAIFRPYTTPVLENMPGSTTLHVKTRMFVVIRPKAQHCLCLPIYTYSQQGTSKAGVKPEDHAPLIKENTGPEYHPEEQQSKLRKPIYLIVEDAALQWNPLSRINFAKIQSVEYNLKVRTVGRVSPGCLDDLEALFREAIGLGED